MKTIYLKVVTGLVCLCFFYFVDKNIFSDINSLYFFGLVVILPVILFSNKIFKTWLAVYLLYVLSNIYIKLVLYHVNPGKVCGMDLLCGGDERPLNFLLIYFGIVFILALLQLRHFVQKKMAEKELKTQIN